MAIQTVNIGTTPNDGTGDPARTAFTKLNDNFTQAENAASKLVATNAQALAGTAGVLPDAAGVHSAFKQFGLGNDSPANIVNDYDVASQSSARIFFAANIAQPSPGAGARSVLNLITPGAPGVYSGAQLSCRAFFNEFDMRSVDPSGNANWVRLLHTGNMQPYLANGLNSPRLMLNASGSTVDNQGDIAGSGLRFCKFNSSGIIGFAGADGIGTWRNVTGLGVGNNEFGLFVRIA